MNIFITEDQRIPSPPIDIYSKLARDRILFINDIEEKEAVDLVATLMLKDLEDPTTKITLLINSSGGDIRDVFMIHDVMQALSAPIETICVGDAMNESVLLLASGTKGMRLATENAFICPSQLSQDRYLHSDLANASDTLARLTRDNDSLMTLLSKKTGKKKSKIVKDFERQQYFDVKQAKTYGLIDGVVQ